MPIFWPCYVNGRRLFTVESISEPGSCLLGLKVRQISVTKTKFFAWIMSVGDFCSCQLGYFQAFCLCMSLQKHLSVGGLICKTLSRPIVWTDHALYTYYISPPLPQCMHIGVHAIHTCPLRSTGTCGSEAFTTVCSAFTLYHPVVCQHRVGFVMSDLLTLACRASSPDGLCSYSPCQSPLSVFVSWCVGIFQIGSLSQWERHKELHMPNVSKMMCLKEHVYTVYKCDARKVFFL